MSVDTKTSALKNVWWVERDNLAIARTSEVDASAEYISPTEIKEIRLHFTKLDEDFVASGSGITMTESPAILAEFHDALAKYAIARGYELNPQTLQVAQYFNNEWEMCIREAKKYANKGRDGSSYHIRQYDY
tara:strand:- start:868 stop:1263 length:396 start_codon:yes stop_codon:yes gene_type:complete